MPWGDADVIIDLYLCTAPYSLKHNCTCHFKFLSFWLNINWRSSILLITVYYLIQLGRQERPIYRIFSAATSHSQSQSWVDVFNSLYNLMHRVLCLSWGKLFVGQTESETGGRFHKSWAHDPNHRDSSIHLHPTPMPNFWEAFYWQGRRALKNLMKSTPVQLKFQMIESFLNYLSLGNFKIRLCGTRKDLRTSKNRG